MKLVYPLVIVMIFLSDFAIFRTEATRNELLDYYSSTFLSYNNDYSKIHEGVERGRFLLQRKKTRRLTCNKSPRVCRANGSPGPKCCKKKCVNVLTDRRNCGKCGRKCKYNTICCNGKCVNPNYNKNHCGGCNNSCNNGGLCALGLCSYA